MIHPAGLGGSPVAGHRCTRRRERILYRLFRHVDVTELADEDGHRTAVLVAEDPFDPEYPRSAFEARCCTGRQ